VKKEFESMSSDTDDLKDRVSRALAQEVGPALQLDGAAIEVLEVSQGVARVRLNGVCSTCPSTIMTVLMGMEQELRRWVPEIEYLEAVP
jgi:Fe-S cluster biogenesis protein NfuA